MLVDKKNDSLLCMSQIDICGTNMNPTLYFLPKDHLGLMRYDSI